MTKLPKRRPLKLKTVTFRVSEELETRLDDAVKSSGCRRTDILITALEDYLVEIEREITPAVKKPKRLSPTRHIAAAKPHKKAAND